MKFVIRPEIKLEYKLTEEIVKKAFSQEKYSDKKEHLLVNKLRRSDAFVPELSLVALNHSNQIVGHVLLSQIKIGDREHTTDSLALAPLSVVPEYQKKGIGSQLIYTSLKSAKKLGYQSVIVLGHSTYYSKFGFKPARLWDIRPPFEVPDEAFMALELIPRSLEKVQGTVYYPHAFME